MFCRQCGTEFQSEQAAICVKCGVARGDGFNFCQNCCAQTTPESSVCTNCGVLLTTPLPYNPADQKSKVAAGLLGIFLGTYGVHNFYLGYKKKAIIQVSVTGACLLLSICTFGLSVIPMMGISIWGLIEGIMILTGNIRVDGKGIPLKD